jgi:hypothetical protein
MCRGIIARRGRHTDTWLAPGAGRPSLGAAPIGRRLLQLPLARSNSARAGSQLDVNYGDISSYPEWHSMAVVSHVDNVRHDLT